MVKQFPRQIPVEIFRNMLPSQPNGWHVSVKRRHPHREMILLAFNTLNNHLPQINGACNRNRIAVRSYYANMSCPGIWYVFVDAEIMLSFIARSVIFYSVSDVIGDRTIVTVIS